MGRLGFMVPVRSGCDGPHFTGAPVAGLATPSKKNRSLDDCRRHDMAGGRQPAPRNRPGAPERGAGAFASRLSRALRPRHLGGGRQREDDPLQPVEILKHPRAVFLRVPLAHPTRHAARQPPHPRVRDGKKPHLPVVEHEKRQVHPEKIRCRNARQWHAAIKNRAPGRDNRRNLFPARRIVPHMIAPIAKPQRLASQSGGFGVMRSHALANSARPAQESHPGKARAGICPARRFSREGMFRLWLEPRRRDLRVWVFATGFRWLRIRCSRRERRRGR